MLSSCYSEKRWSKSPNPTWKTNLNEASQFMQHLHQGNWCQSSEGESSLAGHLGQLGDKCLLRVPEPCLLWALWDMKEASGVGLLTENPPRRGGGQGRGRRTVRWSQGGYCCSCSVNSANNSNTHVEGAPGTRRCPKLLRDIHYEVGALLVIMLCRWEIKTPGG